MNRFCGSVVWLVLLAGCADKGPSAALGVQREAIVYGEDDRREVYAYRDAAFRERVRASSVALIEPRLLQRPPSGRVTVTADSLRNAYGLCDGERFVEQPAGADCSATLIDQDLIVTAGHCFKDDQGCETYAYVFDYMYAEPGVLETLTAADVYGCRQIVARQVSPERSAKQVDYAIVQLDRPALAPRKPVALSKQTLAQGAPIVTVGFTSGVPAKIDSGARVIDARTSTLDFFTLDSDTFQGSSGSGLFDPQGGLLGVLVRGGEDYAPVPDAGCNVATVIPKGGDGAPWEQATYAARAIEALCESGWPSPTLCNIEPRCGDGFCTMDEVNGSCPADCASASCSRPPCTKNAQPALFAGDPASDGDAGAGDGAKSAASDKGCSMSSSPGDGRAANALVVLGLALHARRRRARTA